MATLYMLEKQFCIELLVLAISFGCVFFSSLPSFHSFPPTTTTRAIGIAIAIAKTTINRRRLQLTADSSVGNVFCFSFAAFSTLLTIA